MGNASAMNEEDSLVGRCCKRKSDHLIYFNGSPSRNYAVYLCDIHINTPPFDKNILKIIKLEDI